MGSHHHRQRVERKRQSPGSPPLLSRSGVYCWAEATPSVHFTVHLGGTVEAKCGYLPREAVYAVKERGRMEATTWKVSSLVSFGRSIFPRSALML